MGAGTFLGYIRNDYVQSRKRWAPSAADSSAEMVRRTVDSLAFLVPGNANQANSLRLALEINLIEKLPTCALSPAEQACVGYKNTNSKIAKIRRRMVIKHLGKLRERIRPLRRQHAG